MGMRNQNIQMKTTVKRSDLLTALKKNLDNHAKIVAEAREGYVEQARKALTNKLDELKGNRHQTSLVFSLSPPQDYSETYKSAIAMLEWNTADEVTLEADEFRQLVEDKWDWTMNFYATNSNYSSTASAFFGGMKANWNPN